jgi:hypothetical protein
MRFCLYPVLILLLASFSVSAQIGGFASHQFLNLPVSARAAALGGNLISVRDGDLNLAIINPSLLTENMDNTLMLTYVNYFSDINFGYIGYAKHIEKFGTFSAGLQHINYGKFQRAEANGDIIGEFTAGDYMLNFGGSRVFGKYLSAGANLKFIYSEYERLNALGMAVDLAGTFYNEESGLGASVLFRNFGGEIIPYRKGMAQPFPFNFMIGVSKKLQHAPFRFSLAFENMQNMRMIARDTTEAYFNPFTGEETKRNDGIIPNTLRHLVPGVEILPVKHFSIRLGYNLQRASELSVDSRPGTVGLTWGFGMKIKKFNFSYARAAYHLSGASNHFTITTNLSSF